MPLYIKRIFIAVIFNILFEFSLRGFKGLFLHKLLFIFLFLLYFCYFYIIEYINSKFKLHNIKLILIAFLFGTYITAFFARNIFANNLIGINLLRLLYINIVWWAFLQTLLTLYIVNRIYPKGDNSPIIRNKKILVASILYLILLPLFTIIFNKSLPEIKLNSLIFSLLIIITIFIYLKNNLREKNYNPEYNLKSKILDIVSIATIISFLFSGIFLTNKLTNLGGVLVSIKALNFINIYTGFLFICLLLYILISKKQIV